LSYLFKGCGKDTPAVTADTKVQEEVKIDPVEQERLAIEKQKEERKKLIERQFSGWDGHHMALERAIKKLMNDPDSYEHVKTGYWDRGDHIVVNTTFRGKNSFGAMVLNTVEAKVSFDGTILELHQE
jgi:hypothetical protein